jgi:hypothetical protein
MRHPWPSETGAISVAPAATARLKTDSGSSTVSHGAMLVLTVPV